MAEALVAVPGTVVVVDVVHLAEAAWYGNLVLRDVDRLLAVSQRMVLA